MEENTIDVSKPAEFSTQTLRGTRSCIRNRTSGWICIMRCHEHIAMRSRVYLANKKYYKERERKKRRRCNKRKITRQALVRRCITRYGINPAGRRGSRWHSHLPCFSVRRHNSLSLLFLEFSLWPPY